MVSRWQALWEKECESQIPAYSILVPDSVSESVRATWRARGYKVTGSAGLRPLGLRRNLIKSRMVFAATAASSTMVTGAAGLSTLGISMLVDSMFFSGTLVTAGLGTIGVGLSGWTGWKYLRDPKRLTRKGRESAARAQWITPQTLGYVLGKNNQDTDEQRLMQLAVQIARTIKHTKAWNHPTLVDHVSRVDLDYTLAGIGQRLVELYKLRIELNDINSPHVAAQIGTYRNKLTHAFKSMSDRVVAMHDYLEHLQELSAQLVLLEHTERSRDIGEQVLDVLSRTSADESAQWHFQELNLEAQSHAEIIRGLLGELEDAAEDFEVDDLDRQLARARQDQRGTHKTGQRETGQQGLNQPESNPQELGKEKRQI